MNFNQRRKTFAIIGAGPKGIAVAVKAKVLQEFGFDVDQIILIEKNDIAAHWSGEFGYTDGEMKLGTPPEKDVIFPVEVDVGNDVLNARIRERLLHFSWASFLIHTGGYSDWVDKGRQAPKHKLWAAYLQWVVKQLTPDISIVRAEVIKIDLSSDNHNWELTLQTATKKTLFIEADRLMLTGPGKAHMDFPASSSSPIYDLESFWHALKEKTFSGCGKIAIVGVGEHAASALIALSQYASQLQIDIISPKGFISSRAESYYENQMFSQSEKNGWKTLAMSDRLDFMKRTDLGVFSLDAMNILSDEIRHKIIPGRVIKMTHDSQGVSLHLNYQQKKSIKTYDQVILATGFDQVAMLKSLLSKKAERVLEQALDSPLNKQAVTKKIAPDLSVRGMYPYLHLPMLAGLMQGPGFANLSCLGHLSDRLITNFSYKQPSVNQKIIPFLLEPDNEKQNLFCG